VDGLGFNLILDHLFALLLRQDNTLERLGSASTVLGLFEQ
jgi:hypothetical protein